MAESDLTANRIRDLLEYDPLTGVFSWRVARGSALVGVRAGTVERNGYRRIKIDRRFYYAHRLAHIYMTGAWPARMVDHRNGARDDNRWANLRECDTAQNAQNTAKASKNTSGLRGVHWHKAAAKWRASIMVAGKNISLGLFFSKDEAHSAYLAAKSGLHAFQPVLRNA